MMRARHFNDGAEFVAYVLAFPFLLAFSFGIISLNYGAFQRQLIEYGVAHACDRLDPDLASLGQSERDVAIMDAICEGSPLLDADWCDLKVEDTRISFTQTVTDSPMGSDSYGRYGGAGHVAWEGAADGTEVAAHTDSWQVHVQATVTYHVPVLLPTVFYRNIDGNDLYVLSLDRTFVVMRREEVA